jgi:hypothetical protein
MTNSKAQGQDFRLVKGQQFVSRRAAVPFAHARWSISREAVHTPLRLSCKPQHLVDETNYTTCMTSAAAWLIMLAPLHQL